MTLTVALQMDPIEGIDITKDSTFVMGLEAERRGYSLHYYTPDQLSLENGEVYAHTRRLSLRYEHHNHFTFLSEAKRIPLHTLDIVLLRQDPPFNMRYLTTTYLLERIIDNTLVVNNPIEVRNAPEKLLVTRFPEWMPPTLITENRQDILAFYKEHHDIVIKPLYESGGTDVFRLSPEDTNAVGLIDLMLQTHSTPLIAQRFIKEVSQGDKRIILAGGKPIGSLLRVPLTGSIRANLHGGGQGIETSLTERDKAICAAIGPELERRGLWFTGIDIIGGYLTEINVTSPTCLQEINRIHNTRLEAQLWDTIENALANHRKHKHHG